MRYDPHTADVFVFTWAEGLLGSKFGHDLKLRATSFVIEVDEATGAIDARVDASGLRVVAAVEGEREDPSALSDKDRRKIEDAVASDVLEARRYPAVTFSSAGVVDGRAAGRLTLHGVARDAIFTVQGDVAELKLHQPDYGIKPFRALLGALRVQADVRVRVVLRAPARA